MGGYVLELECLSCSNRRQFVRHSEAGHQVLTQADLNTLSRHAVVSCGRCGSTSLIRSWGDAMPDATVGYVPRRRRRRSHAAIAAAAAAAAAPAVS